MCVLSTENELELLLQQLQINRSSVYIYGRQLAEVYPNEIEELFVAQLDKEAVDASQHKEYALVCNHMKTFLAAGFEKRVRELISEYKLRFNRRPSFVDELKKIKLEN